MSRARTPAAALAGLAALKLASATADAIHDPMRPPISARPSGVTREAVPVLSGIVTVEGRRSAILDGRLVHPGSILGPYTVEAILNDGVRLHSAHGARELHLPMPSSPIKKPAAERSRGETP